MIHYKFTVNIPFSVEKNHIFNNKCVGFMCACSIKLSNVNIIKTPYKERIHNFSLNSIKNSPNSL